MKYGIRVTLICGAIALGLLGGRYTGRVQAQDASYQTMSDNFFNLLQQGKGSEAVDYTIGANPEMKKVPDQIDNLKAQFASSGTLAGRYVSHTKLAETKVAGMFVYQHYFVAYERQPISVRIEYYKPGATWVCYGLQFDAELSDEIRKEVDNKLPIEVR